VDTGPLIHIYVPPVTHRFILHRRCPDCKRLSWFLGWGYEWHGPTVTCLRCGREWQDGQWCPLPFYRYARRDSIEGAKRYWRMISGHTQVTR
jgi:Zn ribbon nucleic-acid-binding protein